MSAMSNGPAYDRQLLLAGTKRNAVLDLAEVQRYGTESWGDPDYVCIYGLRPAEWHGQRDTDSGANRGGMYTR